MAMMRIKRNDTVLVLTGKDKGKRGTVLDVNPEKNLIKVKGIAIVTKHVKARRQGETSAIKTGESYIHLSNVMLVSPKDSKPCRVNFKNLDNEKKVRICNRTKEVI